MASPPPTSTPPVAGRCASCGSELAGKFCSNCGTPAPGAECRACGAPLTPGARFCHRCGTPAGAEAFTSQRGFSSALPWGLAAIALVALIALVAGQRFGRSNTPEAAAQANGMPPAAPFASGAGGGNPPDISNMSPAEAASRLYDRVMGAHERGKADTVALFAPMAITAYEMLGNLNLDQRYDLGRIAAVAGDENMARAQADTILAQHPNHLLGLILAGNAARMRKDTAAVRTYHDKLVASVSAERAKQLPEYTAHENDITIALDAKRP